MRMSIVSASIWTSASSAASGTALVGRDQGVGQDLEQGVDRDALVGGEHPDRFHHVDVAHALSPLRVGARGGALGARALARLGLASPLEDGAGPLDVGVGQADAATRSPPSGCDRDAVVVGLDQRPRRCAAPRRDRGGGGC